MRLFVAINFTGEIKDGLIAIRDRLRSSSRGGNFSRDENLHLTLAFLGEVCPSKTSEIKAVLDTVTFGPFDMAVDRLGTFARGRLWWAGLLESEPLMGLQSQVEAKLVPLGFEPSERKFSPHVTIGREVVTNVKPWPIETFGESVKAIELMKSERLQGKLTYAPIFTKKPII
jgi:2'-5' RNA ligase